MADLKQRVLAGQDWLRKLELGDEDAVKDWGSNIKVSHSYAKVDVTENRLLQVFGVSGEHNAAAIL